MASYEITQEEAPKEDAQEMITFRKKPTMHPDGSREWWAIDWRAALVSLLTLNMVASISGMVQLVSQLHRIDGPAIERSDGAKVWADKERGMFWLEMPGEPIMKRCYSDDESEIVA